MFRSIFLSFFLLFFSHFIQYVQSVPGNDQIPSQNMVQWKETGHRTWDDEPTWHQETFAVWQPRLQGEVNLQGMVDMAHGYYKWIKNQKGCVTHKGTCLVAAMWDPEHKLVWASTIPQGPYKLLMKDLSKKHGVAARWYEVAGRRLWEDKDEPVHAEDAIYFNYFKKFPSKTTLPEGAIMAVWGKYPSDETDREIFLCSSDRTPTCQAVARELRVAYRGWTPQPQQQAPGPAPHHTPEQHAADNSAATFSEIGMTQEEIDDFLKDCEEDPLPLNRRDGEESTSPQKSHHKKTGIAKQCKLTLPPAHRRTIKLPLRDFSAKKRRNSKGNTETGEDETTTKGRHHQSGQSSEGESTGTAKHHGSARGGKLRSSE